jgi:hypothetical protein
LLIMSAAAARCGSIHCSISNCACPELVAIDQGNNIVLLHL